MNKNNRVYIELTDAQTAKLSQLSRKVSQATIEDKPIMLLAQIFYDGENAVAICNVTTHEEGIELQKLLSPEYVGEYVGEDYAKEALGKARTQ